MNIFRSVTSTLTIILLVIMGVLAADEKDLSACALFFIAAILLMPDEPKTMELVINTKTGDTKGE